MNPSNEKKWFVYMGDHHEGPFSLEDIDGQIKQGKVSIQHFVWMEGMTDWQMMSQVGEFTSIVQANAPAPPTPEIPTQSQVQTQTQDQSGASQVQSNQTGAQRDIGGNSSDLFSSTPELEEVQEPSLVMTAPQTEKVFEQVASTPVELAENVQVEQARQNNQDKKASEKSGFKFLNKLKFMKGFASKPFLLLVLVCVLVWSFSTKQIGLIPGLDGVQKSYDDLQKLVFKEVSTFAPSVSKVVYSIPIHDGLSDEDFNRLENAASQNLVKSGISLEVAAEKGNPRTPRIMVGTNLPDGTILGIHVKGVSGTLLNHFGFNRTVQVKIKDHFAVSEPIKFADGRPMPQGQYFVYAYDSKLQPPQVAEQISNFPKPSFKLPSGLEGGQKAVSSQNLFLGGEKTKDYASRLRKFHKKVRSKAKSELAQLKQFNVTLTSQFQSSSFQFSKVKNLRSEKIKNNRWNKFSQKWLSFYEHLNLNFKDWTDDNLTNDFFFSELHRDLKTLSADLGGIHRSYSEFIVESNSELRRRQLQEIKSLESSFRERQNQLKSRISVSERNLSVDGLSGGKGTL